LLSLANFVGIVVGFLNPPLWTSGTSFSLPRYLLKAKWCNNAIPFIDCIPNFPSMALFLVHPIDAYFHESGTKSKPNSKQHHFPLLINNFALELK
jgi:hypothetical protein